MFYLLIFFLGSERESIALSIVYTFGVYTRMFFSTTGWIYTTIVHFLFKLRIYHLHYLSLLFFIAHTFITRKYIFFISILLYTSLQTLFSVLHSYERINKSNTKREN